MASGGPDVRLKLTISYDGTAFSGWAPQPDRRTVHEELLRALGRLYENVGDFAVAGRTDAGVHALANVVSAEVSGGPPPEKAAVALNSILPLDLVVLRSEPAPEGFSARYDARSRSYRYRVWASSVPSALESRRSLWHPRRLDLAALNGNAAALVGKHEFTAFTPADTKHTVFVREVSEARWSEAEEHVVAFEITANSFLRHMVRTVVGSMLAGYDLAPLVDARPRAEGGPTAPAHGLYLVNVSY
jgi:tRNA pseudouridine38-40 synthase